MFPVRLSDGLRLILAVFIVVLLVLLAIGFTQHGWNVQRETQLIPPVYSR